MGVEELEETDSNFDPSANVRSVDDYYRVMFKNGVTIRESPSLDAIKTPWVLQEDETFRAKSTVEKDGRLFFELEDGRGWVFNWIEAGGEKMRVVAPYEKLYSVNFPMGVVGIEWGSDSSMSTVHVRGWSSAAAGQELMTAGIRVDDLLVSVDGELVAGMPFGQVLERIWATAGKQPGKGQFYRVVTEGPYGIGVRTKPFKDAPRTGQDILRGTIFEVDEVVEREDDPWTWLHLADNSGWVFDTKDPAIPAVQNIKDKDPGGTLALWRGTRRELQDYMGMYLQRGQETDTHTMTIIDGEDQVFQLQVKNGANLRDSLIDNGFQVYENARQVFNCDAKQLCGTCVVHVMDGESNATVQSVNEMRAMASNPRGFRLSCNTDVYGDLTVRLRPGAILGGGTS